jgi:hypothetical protein
VIRAIADWTPKIQEPFWANARFLAPRSPQAVVILAHHDAVTGNGKVRRRIAEHLAAHGLATCTVGLTNGDEHFAGRMIVNIETLSERLGGVVRFAAEWDATRGLPVAVFGEGYCAAAAMMVAAQEISGVMASGAYCGWPDLAHLALPQVRSATLLIVPGRDRDLVERNERAFCKLVCPSQIAVIGNATRSLRQVGAIHACRYLIRRWCQLHVIKHSPRGT